MLKYINSKLINNILYVLLIIILTHLSNFYYNLYSIYVRGYEERMIRSYGDCEKDLSITIAPQQVIDILPETTITQIKPIETLTSDFYEQVKYTTEVVVLNSIDLKHLEKIYFMTNSLSDHS